MTHVELVALIACETKPAVMARRICLADRRLPMLCALLDRQTPEQAAAVILALLKRISPYRRRDLAVTVIGPCVYLERPAHAPTELIAIVANHACPAETLAEALADCVPLLRRRGTLRRATA